MRAAQPHFCPAKPCFPWRRGYRDSCGRKAPKETSVANRMLGDRLHIQAMPRPPDYNISLEHSSLSHELKRTLIPKRIEARRNPSFRPKEVCMQSLRMFRVGLRVSNRVLETAQNPSLDVQAHATWSWWETDQSTSYTTLERRVLTT